jgi:hypothetical protein
MGREVGRDVVETIMRPMEPYHDWTGTLLSRGRYGGHVSAQNLTIA